MNKVDLLFYNDSTIENPQPDVDIELIINAISSASRVCNQSMMIIDFYDHRTLFKSSHMIYLDEIMASDYKRNCDIPYWALISDATLDKMLSVKESYHSILKSSSGEKYANHICTIEYPISIRDHEFFINQAFTPLNLKSDGTVGIGLLSFSPSTATDMACMIINDADNRWLFNFKRQKFYQYNVDIRLSNAEKGILQRARKGMSNSEIAKDLFITENTVKTHKYRIYRKLNVATITEALAFVTNYHLI